MSEVSYAGARFPVRPDLEEAHRRAWMRLAAPGTWWTGAERVAIASESRRARSCTLCRERKQALSPTAVAGRHQSDGGLPDALVDAIHRIVTDPGRLSRSFYEGVGSSGIDDTHYVEMVGVVVRTVSIDVFCHALGLPLHPLPEPQTGEPSRRRPASARPDGAYVPMIPAGRAGGADSESLFGGRRAPNVGRAMSLVPEEVHAMMDLSEAQYMPPLRVADPGFDPGRAITRSQIELIAGRVSAQNECFY